MAFVRNEEEKAVFIDKHHALLQKLLDFDDDIQDDLAEVGSPVPPTPILNDIPTSVVAGVICDHLYGSATNK